MKKMIMRLFGIEECKKCNNEYRVEVHANKVDDKTNAHIINIETGENVKRFGYLYDISTNKITSHHSCNDCTVSEFYDDLKEAGLPNGVIYYYGNGKQE